ncbi:MAG: hypothetical protein LBI53_01075 [Candidatus Peribacteria bacterium]|nr:hypothetical protein [Candidatus Peribacteria bacterium]
MQSAFLLRKYYLAEVYGDITKWLNNPSSAASLQLPIAHHRYNPDRMVVVKQPSDRDKTK